MQKKRPVMYQPSIPLYQALGMYRPQKRTFGGNPPVHPLDTPVGQTPSPRVGSAKPKSFIDLSQWNVAITSRLWPHAHACTWTIESSLNPTRENSSAVGHEDASLHQMPDASTDITPTVQKFQRTTIPMQGLTVGL